VGPFAPVLGAAAIRGLGARVFRRGGGRSDGGNVLLDAQFGTIADPDALARALDGIPGLVEHGLFPGAWVERVIVGGERGVRELTRGAR
jgi:ribose 5-phosphate isomerase A